MGCLTRIRPIVVGAASACAVLALFFSPDVRAVASALVTITNTASNPALTKAADNPALNAFGTRMFPSASTYASFTVPPGKYLVIDSVSDPLVSSRPAWHPLATSRG